MTIDCRANIYCLGPAQTMDRFHHVLQAAGDDGVEVTTALALSALRR